MNDLFVKKITDELRNVITLVGTYTSPTTSMLIFEGSPAKNIGGLFYVMNRLRFRDDTFLFSIFFELQQQLENLLTYIACQQNINPWELQFSREQINNLKTSLHQAWQDNLNNIALSKHIADLPIECLPYNPQYGLSKNEYIAGCEELRSKIRSCLPNVLEPSLLKKILEQGNHAIAIGFFRGIDNVVQVDIHSTHSLWGYYNTDKNVVCISWKRGAANYEVQYILSNEYQHVAFCRLRDVENVKECHFPPQHHKIKSDLTAAYKRISDYEKSITIHPKSSEMQAFYQASACYEPSVHYITQPSSNHDFYLWHKRVKKLSNNRLFLPQLNLPTTPANSPLAFGDVYVEYTSPINDKITYKARYATEESTPAEKAKAFLLDMKKRHIDYKPGGIYANSVLIKYKTDPNKKSRNRNEFFSQGSPGEVAERLSDLAYLPPPLLRTFFGEVCNTLSDIFEVDDYCDHPTTWCKK